MGALPEPNPNPNPTLTLALTLTLTRCPTGTQCETNNLTVITLQSAILPGHYRKSNLSAEIRRCPDFRDNVS